MSTRIFHIRVFLIYTLFMYVKGFPRVLLEFAVCLDVYLGRARLSFEDNFQDNIFRQMLMSV
ncbi:hypothetical protein ERO13_A07G044466v2 [Gossypium hirsutum]|nr:hypothetical protein ERO13_A07G044466v2 [Gossypium hirsutum]